MRAGVGVGERGVILSSIGCKFESICVFYIVRLTTCFIGMHNSRSFKYRNFVKRENTIYCFTGPGKGNFAGPVELCSNIKHFAFACKCFRYPSHLTSPQLLIRMADINLIFIILVEFVISPPQGCSSLHRNLLQFLTVASQGAG